MCMTCRCRTVLFLAVVHQGLGTTGFDAIQPMSVSTFKCLAYNNMKFFIGRVWESVGNYDFTGIQNIKNARSAGIEYVDGYVFPCLKSSCAPAKNQVEATINRLKSDGAKIGMLWMDIERLAWPADHAHNRQFITDMVNQAESMGVKVGIYSNYYNWEEIVGLDWTAMNKYPLWWANYNGEPGYGKYREFGGWTQPSIHQYEGNKQGPCGVQLDYNWYP
uniref:Glycosyl hydrolase family 25 n=1 Tax=Steinernema glaseri TaxID=37863 RepID=A0A1I7YMQ9_9BILA